MAEAKTVRIDGKEYQLDALSDAAKANLGNLRMADQEIARLRVQLSLAETARQVFAQAVNANLPAAEADAPALTEN